jgi:purine nucleosidase
MIRQKIIIDCDPGIDDALAILLALQCPELEIVGITICFGNTQTVQAAKNAIQVLSWLDRLDIPVYIGAEKPWTKELITAAETHGENGLGEIDFPAIQAYAQKKNAVDFMLSQKNKGIALIALAPLTNIANALKQDAYFLKGFQRFISMGGAFRTSGNSSPVAEFNYWSDPDAAAYIYANAGFLIEMMALDATRNIVLTPEHREKIRTIDHPLAKKIFDITQFYVDFHWTQEQILGCVINDPLVIAYLVQPEICTGFETFIDIETAGKCAGQTIVDAMNFYKKPANTKILTQVDAPAFFDFFFKRVFKK